MTRCRRRGQTRCMAVRQLVQSKGVTDSMLSPSSDPAHAVRNHQHADHAEDQDEDRPAVSA